MRFVVHHRLNGLSRIESCRSSAVFLCKGAPTMPEEKSADDPMILILAELKSLNRTLKLLAAHLMDIADHEAPPGRTDGRTIPFTSDELPQRLPEPIMQRLHEMEPRRRDHLLSELRRAWEDF